MKAPNYRETCCLVTKGCKVLKGQISRCGCAGHMKGRGRGGKTDTPARSIRHGLLSVPISHGPGPSPALLNTGLWTSGITSPEDLSEMPIRRPFPRPSQLETLVVGPSDVCFHKSPGGSDACPRITSGMWGHGLGP